MSLSTQFYTMLAMVGMGSFFGASLDTYQRFLKRGSRHNIIVFLNDILFWLLHGVIIFYVLFLVNFGEIRFYLVLAILCGFAAYQALIKGIYLRILEGIISFFKATWSFIQKLFLILIYRPIKGMVLLLFSILLGIGRIVWMLVKGIGIVLLWIIKIIGYPFTLLAKGILMLLPKSWVTTIQRLFHSTKNILNRMIRFVQGIIRKYFSK
ncbi:spore cortex biosynthesis protein YabQ [Lederbergia sp. NSJ-179]|uniref:spore cortex biosynthesis protein YabQ n=1 Tax=Lederbergia sp. NSJ-179 TaxID=2931402 RepID=UPI001FD54D3F|nr:spore cortex biosynthesis protein YabQ [Lederbergia sp. NSJ-179]MCJ7843029.1 spore cortex biosynthesis protein YabQ [Lederbergia sp. NSJ-179]